MFHLSFSFCSIASFPSKHKSFLSFKFKTNKTLSILYLGCKVSQWCMYWNNLQRNLLHKVIYISLQFLNVCKVFKIDFDFYISDLNAIPREELLMAPVHLDLVFAVRCKYWKISNISKNQTFFIKYSSSLGCGESASENNTYMIQASTTSFTTNPCVIKLCPVSSSICRIRYDLSVSNSNKFCFNCATLELYISQTFVIASQTTATNAAEATAAPCKFLVLKKFDSWRYIDLRLFWFQL